MRRDNKLKYNKEHMHIQSYKNHVPQEWLTKDSFLDRNPNMSYLVSSGYPHTRCVLIDASGDLDAIINDLDQRQLTLDCILLTHTHLDHTFGLNAWVKKIPDIKIGVHRSSLKALSSLGFNHVFPLEDGMVICVENMALSVIYSPGHTWDSVCFWDKKGNNFFSGDVIFGGNIGCSDYHAGGNRNIFYQTIINLLKNLPSHTNIYPGHCSEIYKALPPYSLSGERVKNSYLSNVLQGKRGNFDRDLKDFSVEFEVEDYDMLHPSDIDKICALEKEVWIPELQASRETILTRFNNGHKMLAIKERDKLLGMVGWCYSRFSIQDPPRDFPRKFSEFSACKSCSKTDAQSAFIYNVGVKLVRREKGVGSSLLQWAFEKIGKDGINQVFLDSRMPSYNGSEEYPHETVQQDLEFKDAIDRYFATNQFPDNRVFFRDKAIRFYMKNGLTPWLISKDFIQDEPSGNMRVICYLNLEQDNRNATQVIEGIDNTSDVFSQGGEHGD